MANLVLSGNTSGSVTLSVPAVSGSNTVTIPAQTGTVETLGVGTAVATTSGTSVTFTGIPSWAKRITVMYSGVTLSTGIHVIQIGSGSATTTGYTCAASAVGASSVATSSFTTGFGFGNTAGTASGSFVLTLLNNNTWTGVGAMATGAQTNYATGVSPALAGALDRVIITSSTTGTFSAGSVNIMWEG